MARLFRAPAPCLRVASNTRIARHHDHELRWGIEQLDSCEVDRVEGSHGFYGEGLSCAAQYLVHHCDRFTAFGERGEAANECGGLSTGYAIPHLGAMYRALGLCMSKRRSD